MDFVTLLNIFGRADSGSLSCDTAVYLYLLILHCVFYLIVSFQLLLQGNWGFHKVVVGSGLGFVAVAIVFISLGVYLFTFPFDVS